MNKLEGDSGLNFIENDNVFRIEKSNCYENVKQRGLKTVEMIRLRKSTYYFIEAKTTPPDDIKTMSFKRHISRIMLKFVHSVYLFGTIKMNIRGADLPDSFKNSDEKPRKITFVLIYNNNLKSEQLDDIKSTLQNYINRYAPKLSLLITPNIRVLNKDMAEKSRFIYSGEEVEEIKKSSE
jgi:hypothetical protein